ncbi:tetratricopeptide repeat protein [Wenzhouxiangella sp. XN79A]|uniref:YfgM family protein n=1 Tax=Wenzhouxiangella sp. XN79A TaxID=2724193 RepID=UPI00144AAAD6|nr:tetratricopeptide repeat protein [Wenzhouxiangella sp. XN79A]NKI34552.1 tetratricopeptide repeat protein [Wenzhouxiangella sp. XN79A]
MAVELYDEHEQSERVRGWLRENGAALVVGVVLALGGIFGFRQWESYQEGQGALASDFYTAVQQEIEADQLDAAREQLQRMQEAVGDHAYVDLGTMLLAGAEVEAGEHEAARDHYTALLERTAGTALEPLVRLRLARLEAATGRAEAGLALLQGERPVGFESLWLEARGDLLAELGRTDEALAAYDEAVAQLEGEGNNARQVQTKRDALRSAAGETEAS